MMGLEEKGMLVTLRIGQWTANRKDKAVGAEVAENHGSDESMGVFRKALVAREGLKRAGQAANAARAFHYENTLPWADEGARILPAANFFAYRAGIDKLVREFNDAALDVVCNYEEMKEDARRRLNGLYCDDDYPGVGELAEKYYITVEISPIPVSSDFRLSLSDNEMETIRAELTERLSAATERANRDAWGRLYETVNRFVESLPKFNPAAAGAERGIFRDTLVTNAVELCKLLERLNITGDADLEQMRREAQAKLTAYSARELRESETARKEVTKDAAAILDAMAPFV